MTLSRMHLGMLGVVSIFTGMISPVVKNAVSGVPFPLTDLQIPAYIVLFSLAILCVFLAMRLWTWVRISGICISILLGYLFFMAWGGDMKTSTGILVPSLSWGWIFLCIGIILIITSMFQKEIIEGDETPTISDHLLGGLGAITILALTGLIINISYVSRAEQANKNHVISSIFGSGSVEVTTDMTKSIPFSNIEKLSFDRKTDALSFFTSSGNQTVYMPEQKILDHVPYAITTIGEVTYNIDADSTVSPMSGGVSIGKAILPQSVDTSILMQSGSHLISLNKNGITPYPGEYTTIEDILKTKQGEHTIWKSQTGSGYTVYIDGVVVGDPQYQIHQIAASSDGKSIMTLAQDSSGTQFIIKNGVKTEKIYPGYIAGSLKMNGTESLYAREQDGVMELIRNGTLVDRKFAEIRQIFLDADGGGYVYFGRPLGEQTYCLYTRYRGNLCGFAGYMNPEQSPDSSVIYAGFREGVWGIYRNTTTIIRNTGYPHRDDISRDYVFFDVTNPNYYLFISWDNDGYRLYKKGEWVSGTWKDVGLDVTFGYDNKVIMSAQEEKGWRILEF